MDMTRGIQPLSRKQNPQEKARNVFVAPFSRNQKALDRPHHYRMNEWVLEIRATMGEDANETASNSLQGLAVRREGEVGGS
mmetsp:Transcript_32418/g.91884  ORF Transcript_32418/g.91884 Transcript_32418/m.91884 type:complete len:81 (-) Transcript_32418:3943-4185(-)